MTKSGSGSSRRLEIHGSCFFLESENLVCHTLEGPDSHGSRMIVNSFVGWPGEGGKGRMGRKVRRNEASELRDLTVRDILVTVEEVFEVVDETIDEVREAHNPTRGWLLFRLCARPERTQGLGGGS